MMEMLLTLREEKVKIGDKVFIIKEMTLAKTLEYEKFVEVFEKDESNLDFLLNVMNLILTPKIDKRFLSNNFTKRFISNLLVIQIELNSPFTEKEIKEIKKRGEKEEEAKKKGK